jgi:L-fuconolactonase
LIVDSHQHFWDPAVADYPFLTDEVAPIRKAFGPAELGPLLAEHEVAGTILVQSRSSLEETDALVKTAAAVPFVLGVVGWVDLTDAGRLAAVLDGLGGELVGIRHQVHDEPDPEWLLRPDVQQGLAAVAERGLVYDLLVRTRELPAAREAVRRNPDLSFVVDHLAKPPLREESTAAWAEGLAALAAFPNVVCKLSGLVTEADWSSWREDELVAVLGRVLDWFGPERCLFGSDWPVCLLAADYGSVLDLVESAIAELAAAERAAVLSDNALRVYGLEGVIHAS